MQDLGLEIHTAEHEGIESDVAILGKGGKWPTPIALSSGAKYNKLIQVL